MFPGCRGHDHILGTSVRLPALKPVFVCLSREMFVLSPVPEKWNSFFFWSVAQLSFPGNKQVDVAT